MPTKISEHMPNAILYKLQHLFSGKTGDIHSYALMLRKFQMIVQNLLLRWKYEVKAKSKGNARRVLARKGCVPFERVVSVMPSERELFNF